VVSQSRYPSSSLPRAGHRTDRAQLNVRLPSSGPLLQLNQTGELRILAVTSEKRLSGAPRVPTVFESGMPDLEYAGWFGLFAPKATPGAIVDRIAKATRLAMAEPVLQETYRVQGMEPDTNSSPDKFQRLDELMRLTPIIKSIGLKRD
jgi:tripartite-type tricarboxylate transporter receptor subunit TctC